jgi:hypothetical protein
LQICRASTTLKSEGEVTSLSGADKEKWETTGRSGESTGRNQNISIIPLQHLSDKIIQHPLQTVHHFTELMNYRYIMWSKSSHILLQPVSRLKVYVVWGQVFIFSIFEDI